MVKTIIYLIGNKCDLPQLVRQEEIDDLIKVHQLKYFKTSAKDGTGIDAIFQEISQDYFSNDVKFLEETQKI